MPDTWTPAEDKRLLQLDATGMSLSMMAAALRRSSHAVDHRLHVLKARTPQDHPEAPVVEDQE
jgi:hypothetical protein